MTDAVDPVDRVIHVRAASGLGNAPSRPGQERKSPAGVSDVTIVVARAYGRRDCHQRGISVQRRQPLHGREIGRSEHADLAVRPGLFRDPGKGIVAVVDFLEIGIPAAVGIVTPAHGLKDECVAVGGGELRITQAQVSRPVGVHVAYQQRGILATFRRQVHVGRQSNAVAHFHGHMVESTDRLRKIFFVVLKALPACMARSKEDEQSDAKLECLRHEMYSLFNRGFVAEAS